MTILQKKIATAIASAALLVNSALPVFATTIEISGNGSDSDSEVDVEMGQTTTVVQSNEADVTNVVNTKADTGGNKAKDNTNSDVEIETGNATVDVNVENTLNSNSADIDCCPSGDVDVLVSGNGSDSDNNVWLDLNTETDVFQTNEADVKNLVWADAKTGDNEAEDNTGGSVSIKTGIADVTVDLATTANANSATIGGGSPSGSLSARILGNGSDSENEIDLELASAVLLEQANEADILNKVDVDAETGDNEADDNTGGETDIETGNATVDVSVDNMVNFNWADVECGCLLDDILAKISGNGTDSENEIELELGAETLAFQLNCADEPYEANDKESEGRRGGDCELENFVDLEAESGDNEAEDNTGGVEGDDPSIDTGNAEANADIQNSGNVNMLGEAELPELDFEVDFGFNWALFWAWVSGMSS